MSDELRPAPDWDFGGGWAEITETRFGYSISVGTGPGVYERTWFRFRHKAAQRLARRLIDRANRENQRYENRERLT